MPSQRLVPIREELASFLVTRSPHLCLLGHRAKLPLWSKTLHALRCEMDDHCRYETTGCQSI